MEGKMNRELILYLKNARPKEDHEFLNGIKQSDLDYRCLDKKIQTCLPFWIKSMLIDFEIANLIIDFKAIDIERLSIQFNCFKAIEDACLHRYPGCAIFDLSYIGIGEDPTGSGDPFFINLNEGNNPPVYQIFHDVSDIGEKILQKGKKRIAHKLSDIFRYQIL